MVKFILQRVKNVKRILAFVMQLESLMFHFRFIASPLSFEKLEIK